MSRHDRPNVLSTRELFQLYQSRPRGGKTLFSSNSKNNYLTSSHPSVHVPGSSLAPPGLSTEFMWECVYDKIPTPFLSHHNEDTNTTTQRDLAYGPLPHALYSTRRYGEKRHFANQTARQPDDSIWDLLDYDHLEFDPQAVHSSSYRNSHHQYTHAGEFTEERQKVRGMWRGVQDGTVPVGDIKAEMNWWRDAGGREPRQGRKEYDQKYRDEYLDDVDEKASASRDREMETTLRKVDIPRHQQRIAKIGYGRVPKGKILEEIWYDETGEVDSEEGRMRQYCHERNVADIGYGRISRGRHFDRVE